MPTLQANHLIIGLGGTGGRVIRAFRKTVYQELRTLKAPTRIGYLYVDSNGDDLDGKSDEWKVLGHSVALDPSSKLQISDADVSSVFENSARKPGIAPWIGDHETLKPLIANCGKAQGAQQIRRFGRFLFASKITDFNRTVSRLVEDLQKGGKAEVVFHICCTLAAGTGSGSLIDAVSQIRKHYPNATAYPILIYALVTDGITDANTGNFYPNQYAALSELNALVLGKFQPHDVEAVNPARLALRDNYLQCFLLSDKNEQKDTASREEQEQIIADYLFQKLIALKGNLPDRLVKTETLEDLSQYAGEPGGDLQRSYRFGTFGVKRFAIPEQEIREKLTFAFAQQAARQFQFNNWTDNGFTNQARNRDLPELVTKAANNERWFVTLRHLTLDTDFRLSGGTVHPSIADDWDELDHVKAETMADHPGEREKWLATLREYAQTKYETLFRERGVVAYYDDKRQAKMDYAREIRNKVEADLFDRWRNGDDAVAETQRILDVLLDYLARQRGTFDSLIANERSFMEGNEDTLKANEREWAKIGLLGGLMGKPTKIFEAYTVALKEKFKAQTKVVALGFARELTQQVIVEITGLKSQVAVVAERVAKAASEFENKVRARVKLEEEINYTAKLVRLVEPGVINTTITRLVTDRKNQEAQALHARAQICNILGVNQTFTEFAKSVSETNLLDVLSASCDTQAETAHANLFKEPTDYRRIIGVNIIEKLNEQYGGLTPALKANITTLMESAAAYLTFDDQQTSPAVLMRNGNIPAMPRRTFAVFLPKCPALEAFREELKGAFTGSLKGGNAVYVVETDHNPNEITIISTSYWFALRFAEPLKKLRQNYEAYMRNMEMSAMHQIHLENHRMEIEGLPQKRGTAPLPNLFLLDDRQTQKKSLPVLLLAQVFNMLEMIENPETGLEGLYFVEERSATGRALRAPVDLGCHTLTDLSNKILPDQFEAVEAAVGKRLASGDYRHVEKKKEVSAALDATLDKIYEERGRKELDKVYIKFQEAVADANRLLG